MFSSWLVSYCLFSYRLHHKLVNLQKRTVAFDSQLLIWLLKSSIEISASISNHKRDFSRYVDHNSTIGIIALLRETSFAYFGLPSLTFIRHTKEQTSWNLAPKLTTDRQTSCCLSFFGLHEVHFREKGKTTKSLFPQNVGDRVDLWPGVPCLYEFFDLFMALRSTLTRNINIY